MLLDLLIGILLLLFVVFLGVVLLCAWLALPLTDILNRFFRLVGLAGPSPQSRTPGSRAAGVVADRFNLRPGETQGRGKVFAGGELWSAYCPAELVSSLREGDAVEVVYNEDLSVTVLRK
jgi:membrane protein implicated in regulation of membrane protease activity